MANQCKYYKEILQVSYDSGVTWVNMGETRKGDLYEYNSPACGAIIQYRWVDVTGQYTCEGTTKYQKTKRQYSEDGGVTWQDVSPAEYGKGDVIEYQSSDCGYVPPPSYSGEYLTFVAIDDGQFKFISGCSVQHSGTGCSVQYSLDEGSTWSTLDSGTYSPTVYAGQRIMWKKTWNGGATLYVGVGEFISTGRFNVEGNAMSLVYGDDFDGQTDLSGKDRPFGCLFSRCTGLISAENLSLPATTLSWLCYNRMFEGCTGLIAAPQLPATTLNTECYYHMFDGCTSLTIPPSLPATELKANCYEYMFNGCTSLTTAPSLPTTTLSGNCYNHMFANCTSLTTAPSLPATTLVIGCYNGMFSGCTSLTTAPELPATTLARGCYYGMFDGCTNLNYIKCLATDISAIDSTKQWTVNVASSGTFVKAASMSGWSSGTSGIPTNWTVQNA